VNQRGIAIISPATADEGQNLLGMKSLTFLAYSGKYVTAQAFIHQELFERTLLEISAHSSDLLRKDLVRQESVGGALAALLPAITF
jgi:hypothetical protein